MIRPSKLGLPPEAPNSAVKNFYNHNSTAFRRGLLRLFLVASLVINLFFLSERLLDTNQRLINITGVASQLWECKQHPVAEEVSLQENNKGVPTNKVSTFSLNYKVFGHVHMAKTAGTEINGELASHFERVCGHKGYSYDAYAFSKHNNSDTNGGYHDLISSRWKTYNRGRVPAEVMHEIGFENCDYISMEFGYRHWKSVVSASHASLELHIPCREPLSLLMSMCNHQGLRFDCERAKADLDGAIDECSLHMERFSYQLKNLSNTTLKCFNPFPIENYISYISQFLQRKRVENTYVHRDTNVPRNKKTECIWEDVDLQERARRRLLQNYEYFHFCNNCMNSTTGNLLYKNTTKEHETKF